MISSGYRGRRNPRPFEPINVLPDDDADYPDFDAEVEEGQPQEEVPGEEVETTSE